MNREWMSSAACRNHPVPEDFFPDKPGIHGAQQAERAVAVCRTCPVVAECDQYRRETHSSWGVWGGQVLRERSYAPNIWARGGRHGTEGGAKTHRRRGEKPCESCRRAEIDAREERRKRSVS